MNDRDYEVGPRPDGTWYVRRAGEDRNAAIMPTQAEAIAIGHALANASYGELVVTSVVSSLRRRLKSAAGSRFSSWPRPASRPE